MIAGISRIGGKTDDIKADRIKELTGILNRASKAYYMQDTELMSNYEYDALYDELVQLEKETGITLSNSPTIHVGYEVLSELPKEEHEYPMLSLDKTKDVQFLRTGWGIRPEFCHGRWMD